MQNSCTTKPLDAEAERNEENVNSGQIKKRAVICAYGRAIAINSSVQKAATEPWQYVYVTGMCGFYASCEREMPEKRF